MPLSTSRWAIRSDNSTIIQLHIMKKLVIFDLDGTLLNTITDLGMAANYALKKNGFAEHDIERYPFFVGNGVRKLIERVLPPATGTEKTIERMLVDFKEYYNCHNTDFTEPYPGIVQLLHDLTAMGVKIAVASNKYQAATESIIKHFFGDLEWSVICGQKENFPVKPDPSIVFSILGEVEVPKDDTLFVGDSGVDMETAWRACVDSAGVTWGFRSEKELRSNHSKFIAHDAAALMDIIKGVHLADYI